MSTTLIGFTPKSGPACQVPTVYQAVFTKEITTAELTGKTKEELLLAWSPIDAEQRRLRHQYANACWCDACAEAYQEAYRPGHKSCLNLDQAYRDLIMTEWREQQALVVIAA